MSIIQRTTLFIIYYGYINGWSTIFLHDEPIRIFQFVYIYYSTYIVVKRWPNFTLFHCRPTIDAVLLLTTDVVVHHPRPSMTYSYLARVNRSSVCLYCLQYSGSFYFVYTPGLYAGHTLTYNPVVRIQTSGICNADSKRFSSVKNVGEWWARNENLPRK